MRKTSAAYQQLQTIISEPGCPICTLSQQAVSSYLDTVLWESSTDINMNEILVGSLGLCGRHSRELLNFGGQRLAAALTERASLLATLRRLPDLVAGIDAPPSLPRRLWQARTQRAPQEGEHPALPAAINPCPACVRQVNEEARGLQVLLHHLEDFAAALQAAGGLCLPHFFQTISAATVPQRTSLLTLHQQVWTELLGHLEEFIRTHMDHHHGTELSEPARLSIERAIASLTGEYPVRKV